MDKKEHGDYGVTPRTIAVSAGEHLVWVEKASHQSAEQTIDVARGEQKAAELRLSPIVGQLTVQSTVAGAALVRNAAGQVVARGRLPLTERLAPGAYELSFDAPGYSHWRSIVEIRPNATTETQVDPIHLPVPTSDLTVTSNTPGALIRLDGEPVGFSPVVLPSLVLGTHQLTVESDEKVPWKGRVNLTPNERTWVTATLEPPATMSRSSFTWIAGGTGAVALVSGLVVGGFALSTHGDFESAQASPDRGELRDRGQQLNIAATSLLVAGLVGLSTGAILYYTTAKETGRASSASITRSAR